MEDHSNHTVYIYPDEYEVNGKELLQKVKIQITIRKITKITGIHFPKFSGCKITMNYFYQ